MRLSLLVLVLSAVVLVGCHRDSRLPSTPSTSHYVRRTNADTVLVFVHGLFGDSESTWTNFKTHAYWPKLIAEDDAFSGTDVYVVNFASPYMGAASTIDESVEQMNMILAADEVFSRHKRIIFVCHSMGGLITRGLLGRYRTLAAKVPLIYFFATPTAGADLARLAEASSDNPQIRGLMSAEGDRYTSILIRDWQAAKLPIDSRCAYEEYPTHGVRIVDQANASLLCSSPALPIEANHIDIVKPANREAPSYKYLRQAMDELAAVGLSPSAEEKTQATAIMLATRPVTVSCGSVADDTITISVPKELKANEHFVDGIVSLQQTSNLKDHTVELRGRSESSLQVHYRLAGLDRDKDHCAEKGSGTIVAAFVITRPAKQAALTSPPVAVRQTTEGDDSPAIYGVTGSVTIVQGQDSLPQGSSTGTSVGSSLLPLATVPALQGLLLDQRTRGEFSPALAAIVGVCSYTTRAHFGHSTNAKIKTRPQQRVPNRRTIKSAVYFIIFLLLLSQTAVVTNQTTRADGAVLRIANV